MIRLTLLTLVILASCVPAFDPATPEQLSLTQDGSTYTLTSDKPIERGSVGIRAATVVSPLCFPAGCTPDAEGRVLLQLPEGRQWGSTVQLGQIEELQRMRLVIVRAGEDVALELLLCGVEPCADE